MSRAVLPQFVPIRSTPPVAVSIPRGLTVHLVNPSHLSFGIGVITPRWLFVLGAATPAPYGRPRIVDETLEAIAGEALVQRLQTFREHGVFVLGSFIFGLTSDREAT